MPGVFRTTDPPPPLHPASVSSPSTKGGGGVRGWGVNISEDARNWIGLLQYNPSKFYPLSDAVRVSVCVPGVKGIVS